MNDYSSQQKMLKIVLENNKGEYQVLENEKYVVIMPFPIFGDDRTTYQEKMNVTIPHFYIEKLMELIYLKFFTEEEKEEFSKHEWKKTYLNLWIYNTTFLKFCK